MEDTHFDTMARALGALANRRVTIGVLLGGALGLHGLIDVEAKSKSGTCKPKCGECQRCKKGTCDNKHGKKRCARGKCQPKAAGTACTLPTGGSGSCQIGACATVCTDGLTTCGESCVNTRTDEANCGACDTACTANQVCQESSCFPRGACPATSASFCAGGGTTCGANCFCGRSAEGNVVCVTNISCTTAQTCTSSEPCPAGSACVDVSGCCVPAVPAGTQFCMPKCAAPDPASRQGWARP